MKTCISILVLIILNLVITNCFCVESLFVDDSDESKALLNRLKSTKLLNLQINAVGIEPSILLLKQAAEKANKSFCPVVLKMEPLSLAQPVSIVGEFSLYQAFRLITQKTNTKLYLKSGIVYFIDQANEISNK